MWFFKLTEFQRTQILKTISKLQDPVLISVNLIFNREGESEKNSSPLFYIIKNDYLLLSKYNKLFYNKKKNIKLFNAFNL